MSELELHHDQSPLAVQMDYARAVSTASMLPDTYRNRPADIMLAVGLGQSMGLSPAESLYRIAVIKGKPTASAELIASNVRKAGHRLRITGDETTATATIIRADDPDFEFTATRDLAWAERMGLAKNDNYRKQAGTMLRWRAVTAVAREACPEALYGVSYTPDELGDFPTSGGAAGGLGAALAGTTVTVEQIHEPSGGEEAPGAPSVASVEPSETSPPESPLLNTSSALAKAMYAGMRDAGVPKESAHEFFSEVTGRDIASSKELTEAEARQVLDHLPSKVTAEDAFDDGATS